MSTMTVATGARLHFGPLSYRPQAGRHFGGIGVMVDQPGFCLRLERRPKSNAQQGDLVAGQGPTVERTRRFVSAYRQACPPDRQPPACVVTIEQEMPSHNGLGSGTQLGLAVASGLAAMADEPDVPVGELARRVGRGRRSAVGIYGFAAGGLIVDAGHSMGDDIGALACRLPMPKDWRVLLITPRERTTGLSGEQEEQAFATLGAMPAALTARLCRIVLTELLPAVQSASFAAFSEAVAEYGRGVGEFFAPVQGGTFGHPRTDELIAKLEQLDVHGSGQTSWGPTVFAFVPDAATGDRIASSLRDDADVRCVALRNRGADVITSSAK